MVDYFNDQYKKELEAQQQDNLWWLTPAAMGLGAIALGSYIYKSVGSQGGNLISNMLHFLGRPRGVAVNVEKIANAGASQPASNASGVRSFLTSTFNLSRQKVQLGPIDLIKDVGSSLEVLGNTRGPVREAIKQRVTEAINRRYSNFGNNTSFFSQNLERITFDQVVGNESTWRPLLGDNQWHVMKRGLNEGLISGSSVLDKGIYKTNQGFLRDLRLRNLITKVEKDKIVPKVDLFWQGATVRSLMGQKNLVAKLGPSAEVKGSSYFIDGNVYAYTSRKGVIKEHIVATGQKLRLAGDPLETIRAAKEGRIEYSLKSRTGVLGSAITSFERATGVGTSFKNRYTDLERWVVHPVQRLIGLAKNTAVIREATEVGTQRVPFIHDIMSPYYPEMVTSNPKPVVKLGREVNFSRLSLDQKILTLLGRSKKYETIKKEASNYYGYLNKEAGFSPQLRETDRFIAPPPKGGFNILSNSAEVGKLPRTSGEGVSHFSQYYTAPKSRIIPGITSTSDMANYMFYRVSHLASSSLLGVSFAPAKSLLGNMARLAAIPMIYEAGRQAINYADYLSEEALGISPIKTLATTYAGLRELQQSVRGTLGIQQSFAELEKNYPGSINSGLGFLARTVAAPVGLFGLLANKTSVGKAALGAAGLFGLIGGINPDQSAEALSQEYSGEIKVPVRKGRWWAMGMEPFEGGEIERFDYSWYHRLMKDPKTKSIYGSQDEYWKYHANVFGVPLPTPSNFFGLRNILNPYRLEAINYNTRPYEKTAGALSEVPVFGPVLGETIGKILKPTMYREPDMPLYRAGLVPKGLTEDMARSLGMTNLEISDVRTDTTIDKISKMANVASEPMGVYKFVMEYFGIKLEPATEQTATSANIDSVSKNFYARNFGGGLGQTEFLRRFMLSDYSSTSNVARMINRVPNTSPDWLPGSRSSFNKDKSYYLDFHMGNPFDKIALAEEKLPGAGYESLNELESGQAGVYSPVDRLLILSEVAPYSEAYAHYEKMVSGMKLDPKWQKRVDAAIENKRKVTSIENRYPRYADSLVQLNEHIKDSAAYKASRTAYDYLTHDFLAEIPMVGSKLAAFRDPYEKYRKKFVEGSEFASWYTPWEDIQRPALTDIALSNPLMGAMKGAAIGALLSGPLSFASPLTIGPLSSVTAGAIAGGTLSAGRIALGVPSNYVPQYTKKQSETTRYLDALAYTKARSLEELAIQEGQNPAPFRNTARKTLIGANTPIMLRASLPTSSDKKYFDVFMNTPESSRGELLSSVSPHMAYALNKAWSYNYGGNRDQEAIDFMQDKEIPDFNSLTWHPLVDNKSMGLKLVSHGLDGVSDNYHKYGFYESHEATIRSRMPDLWSESTSFIAPPKYHSAKEYFRTIGQNIADGGSSSMLSTPYGARYTHRLQIDRSRENLDVIKGRY